MSLSLVGLIGFQGYWIHHAVQMEEEIFDRNVNDALHQVVRTMETREAIQFLKKEAPQLRAAALSSVATPVTVTNEKVPPPKALQKRKIALTPKPAQEKDLNPQRISGRTTTYTNAISGENIALSIPEIVPLNSVPALESPDKIVIKGRGSKKTSTVKFGKSSLDSVVIWRLLAAQSNQMDTIKISARNFEVAKARLDTSLFVRMALDSLSHTMKMEVLNMVPTTSIRSVRVNGKVVNIFTDSSFTGYQAGKNFRSITLATDPNTIRFFSRSGSQKEVIMQEIKKAQPPAPAKPPFTQQKIQPATREQVNAQKTEAKIQHLNQVMEKMAAEYVRKEKPLRQRLQELQMTKLLAQELKNRNIQTPYLLELDIKEEPTYVFASQTSVPTILENAYQVKLFPNDVVTAPSFLKLHFPNRKAVVWQNLVIPTFMSGVFTLIILATFSFTLSTILRQKKVSEIKNDFINNMTHEFKTPIATISLALDALVNPKVRKDEVRVDYYARIIKDENRRMHQQVEKVLQTAQMDRNKLQLAFEPIDVHELIKKAAEPFQLHIEKREGQLDLKLDAANPMVWADPSHLSNIIANLLDNANKYSPDAPAILVQTAMISNGLHISVEDQGVGMSREAQKRVFEKFYRVPTGNVHNVKGFGLGLSYVKTMTEAHGGSVHLRSELGRGSKFTIWLPAQKNIS